MAKAFGSQIDLQKIPVLGLVVQQAASPGPASPVNGQLWYDTTNNVTKCYDNGAWVLVGNTTGGSTPAGPAGGSLTGTYPNPGIAAGAVTGTEVAAAIKDPAAATAGLRTLGSGAAQAMPGNSSLAAIATATASVAAITASSQKITNLADPTTAQDAATKAYVDSFVQGLDAKASVRVATTANLSGTNFTALDGVTLANNDRILVKNQTAPQDNGIFLYSFSSVNLGARASDLDTWGEAPGAFVFVEEGTVNADTGWVCTANAGGTLNSTAMPWTQFSGAGTYTNGAGLALTGNVFSIPTGGVTSGMIADGTITDTDVAAANKDGAAGTASLRTLGTGAAQAAAGNDSRFSDSRTPSGSAGGDLTGTYPNPTIGAGKVTTSHILDGTITDTDVNAANKDGSAGVPSLRTLGTGATQAAAGNDVRFGSGGPPNGAASGDLTGTYPGPTIAALAVTSAKIADGTIVQGDLNAALLGPADTVFGLRKLDFIAGTALPGNVTLDQIAQPQTAVSMNNKLVSNVASPVSPNDAATKNYVDLTAQGLDAKQSVRAASTISISGGGIPGGSQTIDGYVTGNGDRILVKDQSSPQNNGIYLTNTGGSWSRVVDLDTWAEVPGAFVFVEQGTVNADTGWVSTADQGGTLNTTPITWVQFSGAGQIIAGSGMTKTGNSLDVGAGTSSGITVNADDIAIKLAPSPNGLVLGSNGLQVNNDSSTIGFNGNAFAVRVQGGGGIITTGTGIAVDTTVATRKFATTITGAMTAGVEVTVTHNLGTKDIVPSFRLVSNDNAIEFAWRAVDTNTIGITADVTGVYTASTVRVVVHG